MVKWYRIKLCPYGKHEAPSLVLQKQNVRGFVDDRMPESQESPSCRLKIQRVWLPYAHHFQGGEKSDRTKKEQL